MSKEKTQEKKRCLWSLDAMKRAVKAVEEGNGLREAARMFNVPVESLRRRVNGDIAIDCKPGPKPILTVNEEDAIADYCVRMAEMGFGLSRDDVLRIGFKVAEKSGRPHPWDPENGMAGRAWYDGFMSRHPTLKLKSPQPLSHARARNADDETVKDFFQKLGGIYARLNLLNKPMQIYNLDESGISTVHKPGHVISELNHKSVWAVTSGEKGKTHTIMTCVSASGQALPPMMIFPRKRLSEKLMEGAPPGTYFTCTDNGWITQEKYLEWFKFFLKSIPPARPVLVIEDGHSSHITMEVIKLAQDNDIHLLCLPSHTTHILQPLDIISVFKPLKSYFNKACKNYLSANPGKVIRS
jgi:hypothetical protein